MDEKKAIWDVLHPKKAFAGGVVVGVLTAGVVALGVTLIVVLTGDNATSGSAKAAENTNTAAAGATAPSVTSFDTEKFAHVRGAENPEFYLVEFSDFECPFCGRHQPTLDAVLEKYEGRAALVYKHFPLSFHEEAVPAGTAAECAGDQGKFWEYGDELVANQGSLGADFYKEVAQKLGLNMGDFETCLQNDEIAGRLSADQQEGTKVGVKGTPATFVVDKDGKILTLISGAVPQSQFESTLEAALAE